MLTCPLKMKSMMEHFRIVVFFISAICLTCLSAYGAPQKVKPLPVTKPASVSDKQAVLQPQYGGNLRIIRMTGPGSPIGVPWETVGLDSAAATPALEKLMRAHLDGTFEPWLVNTYKLAPDLKSITLNLRKDVKFHDGSPFNSEAVKFNLEGFKTAKRTGTDAWASIEVLDEFTIRVNFNKYRNTVVDDLVGLTMASPESIKSKGLDWARWNPVGTGPFEFVSYERDVRTKYKKFSGYWQKGKPYLETVEYLYVKDPMTQLAMMEAGEADLQSVVLGKVTADMQKMGFEIINNPGGTMSLIPDSANSDSPLADKRVRQAVYQAIDREAYVKALGYGFLRAAHQVPMKNNIAFTPDLKTPLYDPQKAKKLLSEAGYVKGLRLKIIPMPGTDKDFMVALQGYLAKVGITVDLEFVDMGKYMDYRRKGWKNGFLCQPFNLYANFGRTMELYFPSKGPDLVSLKRTDGLDSLTEEAVASPKPDPGKLRKIVKAMNDDIMVIPMYLVGAGYANRKGVHDTGFLSLAGAQDWTPEKAWIEKKK